MEATYLNKPEDGEPETCVYGEMPQEILNCNITEDNYFGASQVIRDCPLDLRVMRLPSFEEFQKPIIHAKRKKKEVISIAELLENFHYDETFINYNSSSKLLLGSDSSFNGFEHSKLEESQVSSFAIDYSAHHQKYYQAMYEYSETDCKTQHHWNTGTNTETVLLADSQTQTQIKETKDMSVQTETEYKVMPYSAIKNMRKSSAKFTCSICHRLYSSKSSCDRHMRTHVMFTDKKKIISSVLLTTEAKLELYKKQATRKHQSVPIVIQMPSTNNFQCDSCKEVFPSQKEKDNHFEDCIIEPFFMNKCPECSIKFYTFECLNRHIAMVHKKPSSTNAYYCIFCNENFDTAFTFQVHLDKHLSP